METILEFDIVGPETLHCSGCEQRVGVALRRLAGVREVAASAATQRVRVVIDPDLVSAAAVQARLELMGYTVQPHGGAR